jgi:hypothetical protein
MIAIRVVNLLLATIRLPPLNKQQKGIKENAKQKKRTEAKAASYYSIFKLLSSLIF